GVGRVADVEAGRIEADADIARGIVEADVIEWRQHHVVHAVARRDAGDERAHQEPRERRVAVGEMIDVGLAAAFALRQAQAGKARIAHVPRIGGRHGVAAEPEEAVGAALEAVRRLLAAAAVPDQVVAVARGLEDAPLLLGRAAGERVACGVVERQKLPLARLGDRQLGDELGERPRVGQALRERVARPQQRIAGQQDVTAERFTREKQAARKPERRIEPTVERGLETRYIDAEIAQQGLGDIAPVRAGRVDRLAAAVADDAAAVECELVALGVAAEIVVVVEDQDAGRGPGGAAIEEGGREPADAAADHDQVVAFLGRNAVEPEGGALARRQVRHFERAVVLAAQAGQRRRIARRLGRNLRRGRQPRGDRQRDAIEEVAAGDVAHGRSLRDRSFVASYSILSLPGLTRQSILRKRGWMRGSKPAHDVERAVQLATGGTMAQKYAGAERTA